MKTARPRLRLYFLLGCMPAIITSTAVLLGRLLINAAGPAAAFTVLMGAGFIAGEIVARVIGRLGIDTHTANKYSFHVGVVTPLTTLFASMVRRVVPETFPAMAGVIALVVTAAGAMLASASQRRSGRYA